MKIKDFLVNKNQYKIDLTYQRPANAWSYQDKQCLIDTILRGEPVPIFFLNYNSQENVFYIVDGQQRLQCIKDFHENKIKLSKKFSKDYLNMKTFNGDNPLSEEDKSKFLDYELSTRVMEDYDDERIRLIFSRLQRGKPLNLGEILNAKPGSIVKVLRELSRHPFLEKSIAISHERYGDYPDVARILFYEVYSAKDCGSEALYDFFDRYKDDIDLNSRYYLKALNVLNFLEKCFPPNPARYRFLEKHAWVLALYTAISDLRMTHALTGHENEIREFIKNFHAKIYNENFRNSNTDYTRFYDNVRGGWAEKLIKSRRDTLKKYLLQAIELRELDDRRQITNEEKIAVFAVRPRCERCNKEFSDYSHAEYHHIDSYSQGGRTDVDNIMILCRECHDEMHSNREITIESVSNDEYEEIE